MAIVRWEPFRDLVTVQDRMNRIFDEAFRGIPRGAAEDHQKRELVDQRNQADNLAYQVEKLLNEHRAKLSDSDVKAIEQAVAEARKAAEGEDAAKIKAAIETLTKQSHKLAEELYKQTGGPAAGAPGAAAGPDPAKPAGDVVDAEYTVKGN